MYKNNPIFKRFGALFLQTISILSHLTFKYALRAYFKPITIMIRDEGGEFT